MGKQKGMKDFKRTMGKEEGGREARKINRETEIYSSMPKKKKKERNKTKPKKTQFQTCEAEK